MSGYCHIWTPSSSIRTAMATPSCTKSIKRRVHPRIDRVDLKVEDIGKKVEGPGGGQIWSHIKWATGLASRVCDTGNTSAFLITDIYNTLPWPVWGSSEKSQEPPTPNSQWLSSHWKLANWRRPQPILPVMRKRHASHCKMVNWLFTLGL